MIATLVRLRVTVWQRTPNDMREVGVAVGALVALGTLWVAAGPGDHSTASTGPLLALVFAGWLAGWVFGPIQTGGGDFVRPEWFAMVPTSTRRLAVGLLVAGCAGVGAVITAVACIGLVVYGARLGLGAALVAVPAAVLLVVALMALSKLASELLGSTARSRITLEVTAAQYGLFVAAMFAGWFVLPQFLDAAGALGADGGTLPPAARTVVLALPSGWGVVAVEAAGRGDWALALLVLLGLASLVVVVVGRWAQLLERRLARPAGGGVSRPRAGSRRRALPASPLGAVVGKDLRSWWRDPRRGVEVRSALWAGLFITAAWWVLEPAVLVFCGVIVAFLGAMSSVNVYAMDGTALWCTLLTPGAERVDVRGRQVSWLLIFGPAATLLSVVGLVAAQAWWAIPWVLALVPAVLGAGAGLIPLLSVVALVPETDAHKRSGNPAETGGDATGVYFAMFFALPVLVAPTAALLALSVTRGQPDLAWLAALVGVTTGAACTWGFGAVAARRLAARGPELLLAMRVGPSRSTASSDEGAEMSRGQSWLMGLLTTVSMVSIFPQGLIPLVMVVAGVDDDTPSWFLARHAPVPLQIPVAVAFIVVGLLAGWSAVTLQRGSTRPSGPTEAGAAEGPSAE